MNENARHYDDDDRREGEVPSESTIKADLLRTLKQNLPEVAIMLGVAHLMNVTPDIVGATMLEGIVALVYLTGKVWIDEIVHKRKEFNWGNVGKILAFCLTGTAMGLLWRAGITDGGAADIANGVATGAGNIASGLLEGGGNLLRGIAEAPGNVVQGVQEFPEYAQQNPESALGGIRNGLFWIMTGVGTAAAVAARRRWVEGRPGRERAWNNVKGAAESTWNVTGRPLVRGAQRANEFRRTHKFSPRIFEEKNSDS